LKRILLIALVLILVSGSVSSKERTCANLEPELNNYIFQNESIKNVLDLVHEGNKHCVYRISDGESDKLVSISENSKKFTESESTRRALYRAYFLREHIRTNNESIHSELSQTYDVMDQAEIDNPKRIDFKALGGGIPGELCIRTGKLGITGALCGLGGYVAGGACDIINGPEACLSWDSKLSTVQWMRAYVMEITNGNKVRVSKLDRFIDDGRSMKAFLSDKEYLTEPKISKLGLDFNEMKSEAGEKAGNYLVFRKSRTREIENNLETQRKEVEGKLQNYLNNIRSYREEGYIVNKSLQHHQDLCNDFPSNSLILQESYARYQSELKDIKSNIPDEVDEKNVIQSKNLIGKLNGKINSIFWLKGC